MKRRRFISFVFVLILCFGMSGCGKEKKTTAPNKFQSDYMEVWGGTTVEEGDFRVINGLLYYIDFETMEGIPICNKPNCRHISWKEDRNTKCDAANIDISTVFPYEGKLYGFRSLSDGGSELVVSDLDGGDWKSKGMFITAEEIFQGGVVVGNQMFFLKDVVVRPEDHITEMRTDTVMCVLNFDTMELKELRREKGVFSIQFLGGTKDYQIYSVQEDNGIKCYQCAVVKDDGVQYNLFDYESGTLTEISLNTVDYQRVEVTQDGKGFYYIGDEGKSLYCYHIDSKENEKIVQAEEVGAEKVTVEGVSEEGILFRAFPENELYVKNEEGISNLKLSDRLPTDQAWLSGINDITKDGVYFTYQEKYIGEKEIEGDLLMYDAYIEKEDLFGKTGEMKVIYTPRVSSAGNIVTEE